MTLNINDVKRAILGSGDVTTFAEILGKAICNPPLPVASQLDLELPLPSPCVLFEKEQPELVRFLRDGWPSERPSIDGEPPLQIVTAPYRGQNLYTWLERLIDTEKPEMILLNIDPAAYAAEVRYAASLPFGVGFSFACDIREAASGRSLEKRHLHPDNLPALASILSWKRHIPVLALGKRLESPELTLIPGQGYIDLNYQESVQFERHCTAVEKVIDGLLAQPVAQTATIDNLVAELTKSAAAYRREQLIEESCYFISRLLDVLKFCQAGQTQPRLLVLADVAHSQDIRYLAGFLKQGLDEEFYCTAQSKDYNAAMVMDGRGRSYSDENNLDNESVWPDFLKAFNRYVSERQSQSIDDAEAGRLIARIAAVSRRRTGIIQGLSVRGSIATLELFRSLAAMNSVANRLLVRRAALITAPARIKVRQAVKPSSEVSDICDEVIFGFTYKQAETDINWNSLQKIWGKHWLDKLAGTGELPQERAQDSNSAAQPAVIPVSQNNQELIKQLEKLEYLKKKRDGRYELTGKMLKTLLEQLEKQLETNQITPEEYNRQKTLLQSRLKKSTSPGYKMSAKELARTIMEMIDARDKQWNEGVNFQTMRTYYHIKENNAGERLSEEKRDYYGLQKLIEDLEKRQILTSVSSTDGLMLSGLALDMLLGYLMKSDRSLQGLLGLRGTGRAKVYERSQFVRRYSTGDTFKNIAIRRTLREAVRQRRGLSEIRRSDLRVFLRQQREPVSDIVICLDISGSMGFHQKLLYARIIASGLVQAAAVQGNRVGLVAFSDSGRTTVPLAENNKERLLGVIAGLSARGNTNVGEGIKASRKMLTAAPNDNQKQVILISDGQATAISESAFDKIKGRQEKDLTEESAIEETRLSAARGIKLSVIHIAGEGRNNEDFIRNIARAGKGQIKRIRGARDFQMIIK